MSTGESVVMEPAGGSLIVTRGESSHTRMFRVPLDATAEREIPSDPSSPLFSDHGGYLVMRVGELALGRYIPERVRKCLNSIGWPNRGRSK